MWNAERNRIFVHLRKTGGTSVSRALGDIEHPREKHLGPAGYVKKYGRRVWERAFTFTVIRNPYDALVSDYFFAKRLWKEGVTMGKKQELASKLDFKDWVKIYFKDLYKGIQSKDGSIKIKGNVCTIDGVEYRFNKIIKYEMLEEEILTLPFDLVHPLGKMNQTRHSHWSSYWGPTETKLISNRWGSFIEELGWS
jgi:hypothetical protein